MSENVMIALVGVAGTLAGTILGWILNQLSNRGKVSFLLNEIRPFFHKTDDGGKISINVNVDIINTSGNQKVIRNIKAVFYKSKRKILEDNVYVKEINIEKNNAGFFSLNCYPKSMKNILLSMSELSFETADEPKNFFKDVSLYFEYFDEKDKINSVCVYKNVLAEAPCFNNSEIDQRGDQADETSI